MKQSRGRSLSVGRKSSVKGSRKPSASLLAVSDLPTFSPEVRQGAIDLIDQDATYDQLLASEDLRPEQMLTHIGNHLRITTRQSHVKAVAFAYSFWVRSKDNPIYADFLNNLWAQKSRKDKRITSLHLIVACFITYGDKDPATVSAKRELYNRDVRAIKYLNSINIPPDQMVELADKPGLGLEFWGGKKAVRHKKIENRIVPIKTVRGRIATINLEIVLDDATNKTTYYVDYTEGLHLRIEGFQDYLSENQSRHLTLRTSPAVLAALRGEGEGT